MHRKSLHRGGPTMNRFSLCTEQAVDASISVCVCVFVGDVLLRAFLQCLPSRCSCCLLSLRWREFCYCHADVLFGVAVAVPSTFRRRGCCATSREFYSPQKFARRLCWEFTMISEDAVKIHTPLNWGRLHATSSQSAYPSQAG